ncbi:IclR family transcriptional regulator [Methylobacterium nigriterrae]|uniref:IclR family transcriptional regulator n=1 Tax=Methylobacterium nigriterrae TaxID=3127512 RepID=UPI0030132839
MDAREDVLVGEVPSKPGLPVVRALDRGLALLRAFTAYRPRQTLTQLAAASGLDKGTARRLLHTLSRAGFVTHDPRTGLYGLTITVLELAAAVETGRDLQEVAAPFLAELAERTRATAFLWIHHDAAALCVGRVRMPTPGVEATWSTVGTRVPMNSGAGPRILLAHLPPGERDAALARPLPRRTPASQTDPDRLRDEAGRMREQGFELAVDDFVMGLSGLGVPVFDRSGALAGALSITTPTEALTRSTPAEPLAHLRWAAAEIGPRLV